MNKIISLAFVALAFAAGAVKAPREIPPVLIVFAIFAFLTPANKPKMKTRV